MASSFHLGLSLILIININIEFFSVALIVGTTRYSHSNPVVARIEWFGGPIWPVGCQLIIANLETVPGANMQSFLFWSLCLLVERLTTFFVSPIIDAILLMHHVEQAWVNV